jgi:hypothetical protein
MVAMKVPTRLGVHERVAVVGEGGSVTLAGEKDWQLSPAGRGESERVTVPVNPFNAVTVIVEVVEEPAFTFGEEEVVMPKSGAVPKVKLAVAS